MRLVSVLVLVLVLARGQRPVVPLSFFLGLPKSAVDSPLECQLLPYPSWWQRSAEAEQVGLRMIAVSNGDNSLSQRKKARREASHQLAKSGHLKTGDVLLSMRPEAKGTTAYAQIQMGVTHAGLVYVRDDGSLGLVALNIDSPLDHLYMGQLDAPHYAGSDDDSGVDALHIIRPRGMTEPRRKRLREWISILEENLPRINDERAQIKFQSNYLLPRFASLRTTTRVTATTLGKIILEEDTFSKLPMFCSEFACHLLALSGCTPKQISDAGAGGAECLREPFEPLPVTANMDKMVGLADGPLISLMNIPQARREAAVEELFCQSGCSGSDATLGDDEVRVARLVKPLVATMEKIYMARAVENKPADNDETEPLVEMLNARISPNYSPTAFLVESMKVGDRKCDYVATLMFLSPKQYAKAKKTALIQDGKCGGQPDGCLMTGPQVEKAQSILKDLGAKVHVNGQWGRHSQSALVAAQRLNDLEETVCLTYDALEDLERMKGLSTKDTEPIVEEGFAAV